MTSCSAEWNDALSVWLDGEVSPAEGARIEAHVAGCPSCAAAARQLRRLGDALRLGAGTAVPERVVQRARSLPAETGGVAPGRRRARWLGVTAAAALVVFFGLLPGDANAAFANELAAVHFRAFTSASPCEFTSSDPEAVKAWLSAKVGYSVTVPVLPGARLLGARRCRVAGAMTAALLYREGEKAITLFVPESESKAARSAARFAEASSCRTGRMGEEICVTGTRGKEFAIVANIEPAHLMALLTDVSQR